MAEQNRQKLLLAVLGVLVLGAGSWFVFIHESNDSANEASQEEQVVRKERKVQPKDARKSTRRVRKADTARTVTRRERVVADGKTVKRRERGRKDVRIKKKVDDPWS